MLTLQDSEQQAAALACLEAVYATKPLPELLSQLPQEQQLQAAVLADVWEIPNVSTAAIAGLTQAGSGLSEAAEEQLLHMPAHPACLQPLLKQVPLRKFGNLELAWANEKKREQLLALSLPAMELLLSCDELRVGEACFQQQSVEVGRLQLGGTPSPSIGKTARQSGCLHHPVYCRYPLLLVSMAHGIGHDCGRCVAGSAVLAGCN